MFASKSSIEERALICSIELSLPTFLTRRHDKHTSSPLVPLQQLCAFISQQQLSPPLTVSAAAAPNISPQKLHKPPKEYDVASAREPPDPGDPAMTKNNSLKCSAVAHPITVYHVVPPLDLFLLQCVGITGACVEEQVVVYCYIKVECDKSGGVPVFQSRRCYSGINQAVLPYSGINQAVVQSFSMANQAVFQSCNSGYGDKICNMYHQISVFPVDLGTIQSCRVRLQMNSVANSQAQQESA
jgi:hypothetical protein